VIYGLFLLVNKVHKKKMESLFPSSQSFLAFLTELAGF